jgi:hypothetical protein
MRLTLPRSLALVLALDIVLFLISGIGRFKNAHHGLDYWIGQIDWLAFVVGAFAFLCLAAVAARRKFAGRAATAG